MEDYCGGGDILSVLTKLEKERGREVGRNNMTKEAGRCWQGGKPGIKLGGWEWGGEGK